MHGVIRGIIDLYRPEGTDPHLERDSCPLDPPCLDIFEHLQSEMQSSGRRRHGSSVTCVHCLISIPIDFVGCPGSILEGFGGTTTGTILMTTGDPEFDAVPGVQGAWAWMMVVGLFAATGVFAFRRYATAK